ncbi:hypothetical protein IH779_00500 [Patescibacteria group bacterium]|nr:hypothetical protein [Patescibacteria group bacterium]
MKKIVSLLVLITFLLSFPSLPGEVKAGTGDNVSGWAWSENIGWISFNSINTGGAIDYGVNVDLGTGDFSGYAWSENIGWIQFNPVGPYPETPTWSVCLDLPGAGQVCDGVGDNLVSGWARALAAPSGGWDGWIKLRGAGHEVLLNTTSNEFEGWAWGGDPEGNAGEEVIGWMSFNCKNEQGDPCAIDYKVFIGAASANNPPYILSQVVEFQSYCGVGPGDGLVGFKWTYKDDDSGTCSGTDCETQFDFRVNDVNDPNQDGLGGAEVDRSVTSLSNPDGTVNTQSVLVESSLSGDNIIYNTTYYWWARVWDDQGGNSGWVAGPTNFTTALHAYPWPNFTCNGVDDCSAVPVLPDEIVALADTSTFYDGFLEATSRLWTLPLEATLESGFTTADSPIEVTFVTGNNLPVTLQVTDSDGFSCSTTENLNVASPLPEWKEIAPTGWLSFPKFVFQNIGVDKLLANVLDFLRLI